MHKFVLFTAFAVIVYVCHFDEVYCTEGDATLRFWERDKTYDNVAKSLNHLYRRFVYEKPKHRLRSAQRRWERQQKQMVLENLDRFLEDQEAETRRKENHRRNFPNDDQQKLNSEATSVGPERIYADNANDSKSNITTGDRQPQPEITNYISEYLKKAWRQGQDEATTTTTKPTKKPTEKKSKRPSKKWKAETTTSSNSANQVEKNLSPQSLLKDLKDNVIPKYPDYNITLEVVGRTVEYNDLVLMKITTNITKVLRADDRVFEEEGDEKKVVFIVHGMSVMGFNQLPCMKNLESVFTLYSYYFKHLDKFDIYIMPMANPDGVAAATMKPFWNKNMSPQSACPGVALDRNFDIAWNDSVSTLSSCGQQYPGASPFSEIETQAIRDIFHKYGHKMIGYVNVHSGTYSSSIFKGDAVLYPKGYTESNTDEDKYLDLRGELDEMMRNADFRVYSVTMDSLYNWYGKVSGTSVDYAAVSFGVPFCMEFVMQLYDDDLMVQESTDRETNAALTEVWSRVIDVIFPFMHRSYAKNAAARRGFWFFGNPT